MIKKWIIKKAMKWIFEMENGSYSQLEKYGIEDIMDNGEEDKKKMVALMPYDTAIIVNRSNFE